MSTQVQMRRDTSSNIAAATGAAGELWVDTDKNVVVVNDGVTPGGHEMARKSDTTVASFLGGTAVYSVGEFVYAGQHLYEVASGAASDNDVVNAGGTKFYVIRGPNGYDVTAFGAVGDGATDDTTPIQKAINKAATDRTLRVYFPSAHYVVTAIYDHYNASNNPGFPAGNFYNGRVSLIGEKATDLPQLQNLVSGYSGALIETTSATGPALLCGNGSPADATTSRRTHIMGLAFMGTCSGSVVELDGATQHLEFGNCTVLNKGTGKGVYSQEGLYTSRLFDLHISSSGTNGNGLVIEEASLCDFSLINVTDCGGTAAIVGQASTGDDNTGFGQEIKFDNCQFRDSENGLEVRGGFGVVLDTCWFEQNTGDYDVKVHENACAFSMRNCKLVSTTLSIGSAIIGGNSGTSYNDAVRQVTISDTAFNFCGPTSAQAGIVKYGSCTDLTVINCSFKNNSGRALIIDTTAGVTPTILTNPDFDPPGASAAIGNGSKVVDQAGAQSSHLVRGSDHVHTITADLNMSAWLHLPDRLNVDSTSDVNVTLPSNVDALAGKTISLRKTLASNTLTVTANIAGASSIAVTADESVTTLIAHDDTLYGQLS